nr:PREDICTED: YLP motif-containing protein 1 isoform X1 [Latimeria chalumnae]|eukprot:XP_014341755.1 PREDICTED: YLP motif-containing protein 1 isoform X1 [Latimeria chalumnae]
MYPSWGRYGGAGHYPPSQMQQHYGGSQPVQQQQQPYGGSQPAQQHYGVSHPAQQQQQQQQQHYGVPQPAQPQQYGGSQQQYGGSQPAQQQPVVAAAAAANMVVGAAASGPVGCGGNGSGTNNFGASSAFQSFRQQHLEQLQQLQQMHQKQMQSVLLPPNHAEDWQASRGSAAGTMSYQQQQQALHHHQQSHHASPFDQQQEQPEPVSLPPPPQQQLQLPPLVSQQQHAQAGQLQHPPPVCQIQQQAAAPHHQSAPEAPASSDPQNQVQQQQVAPSINHAQMHPQANQTQLQQQPTVPVPISNNLPQQQGNSNEVPSSHQVQQRQLPQTDTSSMSLQEIYGTDDLITQTSKEQTKEQQQYWYKMHLLSLQQKAKGQQQSQTAGRDKLSEAQQESKPPVPPPPQEPPRNEPPPPPPRDEPPPPLPPDEPKPSIKPPENPEEEQRLKQLQAAAAQWQQQQQQRVGYQYQAMMQQHAQLRQLLQQYQQLIQNPPHLHTMSIDMQLRHYEMQQQQFTVLYQQWERQFQQWQDHLQSYPHKDQLQNYKNQWIQWQEQMKTTKSHLLDRVEALKNIKQQYMSNPYMGSVPTMPPYVHYPPPQVGVTTPPLITGSTSAVPSIPQITGPSLPLKLPPISVPQEASVTGGPQAQMSPQVPLAQQAPPVTSVSSEKEQLEPPAKKESPPIAAASSSSSSSSTVTVTTTTTTAAAASSSTFTNTLTTPSGPVPSTGLLGVRPSKPAPDPAKSMQSEGSRFDGPCGRGASTVDGPRVRLEGPRPRAPWFEGQQLEGPRSRFEGQHLEGPPTHSGEPPTRPSLLGPGPRPPLLETPRGPIPRLNQSRGIPPLMSGPQACGPRWRTPRPLFGQAEEKIQPAAEKKEPLQEAPQKPEFEDKTLPVQHTQYDSKVKKDALGSRDSLTPERPPKFITKVQNQEAPQKTEGAVNTETIAAGTNVVLKPSDTLDQKPVAVAESPTTLITTSTKSTTVTSASSSSAPFVPEYKNSEPLDLKPPHPEFRQEKGPGRGRGSSRNMNRRNQNVAGFNKRPPLLSDEPGGLKHHGKNEGQKQVIVDKGKGGPLLEREKFEHWKQEIPLREPELDFDDPYRREERPLLRRPMFPHEERWDHESGPYDLDHNRDLDRFGRPHDYPGREFDQEFYRLEDRDLHERRDFPPFPPQIPMNRFREERWREDRTRESYEKDLRDRGELQIWEYPERPEFRRDYYEPEKFDWERERIEGRRFPPDVEDRRFPPDVEDRRFPPDIEGRRFPPDVEDRRFPPDVEDRRFPPDDRRFPPDLEDRRFPPDLEDRRFPPDLEDRRFPPDLEGRRFPPDDRRFPPDLEGRRFPPDDRRFPPDLEERRFPPDDRRFLPDLEDRRFPPDLEGRRFPPDRRFSPDLEDRGFPPDDRRFPPDLEDRRFPPDDRRFPPDLEDRRFLPDDRQFPPDLENRRFPPDNRQFPPDLEDRRFITGERFPPDLDRRGFPPDLTGVQPPLEEHLQPPPTLPPAVTFPVQPLPDIPETPETDQPVSIGGVVALSQRQHEIILKAAQELKMLREQQEKQQKFKDGEPGAPSVGRLAEGGIPGLDTDTSEMDLQAQPATTESAVAPAIVEPVSDPSVERWDTDSFQGLWDSTSDKVDDPGLGFPQQVLETEQLSTPAPALLPPLNTVPLPQQSLDYGHGRGKEHIPYGERITLRPTPILERPYEKDHNIPRDRYERDLYLDRRGNLNTDRRDYDRDRELYRDRSVDYDRGDRYERDRHSRGERMPRVPSPRPPSYRDKDAYRRGGFDRPPYERAPDRPPYDHGPPVYGGERHGYSDERIPVPAPGPAPPLHPQPALPPPRVEKKPEMKNVDDILKMPGRQSRPERIVVIMRGLPGSGKTHVAKLIRDKEVEFGGAAPRVLSLDDYFMTEVEKTEKDPDSGKRIKKKVLEYEYEPEMEETYRNSMFKSFRKTLDDGFFPFIILDAINDRVKHFQQFWSAAKTKGFEVYIAEMSSDNQTCAKRNIHGRKLKDITKMAHHWETAPRHMMRLDIRSLLQDAAIEEVEMEDFDPNAEQKKEEEKKETVEEEESDLGYIPKSKWEMDTSEAKLDKLDGIRTGNKRKRGWESIAQRMEDYLQLPDDYATRASEPGKKRVRWADLEEKKDADRKRAIGFVVGQTDWEKITDETGQLAERALNRTKYF